MSNPPCPATPTRVTARRVRVRVLTAATLVGSLSFSTVARPAVPPPAGRDQPGQRPAVQIRQEDGGYRLYQAGAPYFIQGVGGSRFLGSAAAAGANSLRTWGAAGADQVLAEAERLGMTVLLGIWLSHNPADYLSDSYRSAKTAQVRGLLDRYRHHPALLMWALGNEINLGGADTESAWSFVDDLARLIHSQDPDHPVISVITARGGTLDRIARYAPALDAVGINAYGALPEVRKMIEGSSYPGPYLITEWGVQGHWEARRTPWGRPLEATSEAKATWLHQRYRPDILANRDRCLGSYVFLWGQKQERTPTWYSMILPAAAGSGEGILTGPRADAMSHLWSGEWPANRAPAVTALTLARGAAQEGVSLAPEQEVTARVEAWDPEGDPLTYRWELLEEPTLLGSGGSHEPPPSVVARFTQDAGQALTLSTPKKPGAYRLFVYVSDEHGHVGTANLPLLVD